MADLGVRLRGTTLQATGWRFKFDRARTRLGCCTYTRGRRITSKVISLSRPFSVAYGWELMEDVMRHEIAHALDVDERRTTDHGERWKEWARLCGADPARLYEDESVRLPARYVAVCPVCDDRTPFHRRPRKPAACATCCKRYSGGRYDNRFRLTVYDSELVPGRQMALFDAE